MIIMPNNPALVSTNVAEKIVKTVLLKTLDSVEFEDLKQWNPTKFSRPDFATIDEDGEFHLFYIVVTHVDPHFVDGEIEEIAKQLIPKKKCKRAVKGFLEEFDGEVCDGDSIYVEVAFLVTRELDMLKCGTIRGCTVYEKKVKSE